MLPSPSFKHRKTLAEPVVHVTNNLLDSYIVRQISHYP
jgi:hypothetical protein